MKQLTKTIGDKEVIFIEVPKDAKYFEYFSYINVQDELGYKSNNGHHYQLLPHGKMQLIGSLDSITEEEAAKVVDNIKRASSVSYPDYDRETSTDFNNALSSLRSLIKSLGIETVNPLGKRPHMKEDKYTCMPFAFYQYQLNKWELAQSKVWEKVIILINK